MANQNASLRRFLVLGALCNLLLLCTTAYSQSRDRKIDKLSWRNEPIKIVKMKTKGRIVDLAKHFDEDDDWLSGFTITVENTSDKAIARVVLNLYFLRPDGSNAEEGTYVERMIYGRDPSEPGADRIQLIQSGERAEVRLLEGNLPVIRSDLKNLGYPDQINRTQITVGSVTFADGSMWAADEMLYPDPSNPLRKLNPKMRQPDKPPKDPPVLPRNYYLTSLHLPFGAV